MLQQKNQIRTNKNITYVIESIIGSGTGGSVYKAYKESDQRIEYVALKLQNSLDYQEEQTLKILNEHRMNHIVNVLDLDTFNNQTIIIMDLASGSFQEFWRNSYIVDIKEILNYFLQIVIGTQELHSLSLIHRDLKLDNVVYMDINNQKHLKLCDTGLMRQKDGRKTMTVGTPYYMSPEQINKDIYDEKVDIWSLGMLLYEMLCKKTLVKGNFLQDVLYQILNLKQDYIDQQIEQLFIQNMEYSTNIKILLKQMIKVQSNERATAEEIAIKLKQILKINKSELKIELKNSNFLFNSVFRDQIRQEVQKEFDEKQRQESEKLQEQHQKELQQIKEETLEYYQKQMTEEIIKVRKECEENLRDQFEQDLKNKEQQLQEEHKKQLIYLNEKQQQELKNSQAEEMMNYKQFMEKQFQLKVEQQITQKEQIIQQSMENQIQKQVQYKEQYLKQQLQEQLQKHYQQEFEQKSRDLARFQNILTNTQKIIFKNQILIEDQLKQLNQQQQKQQMPSQKYQNYIYTFQKQLQDKLNQLQLINAQLPQFTKNFNQQQCQFSNQIDENLKQLTLITNRSKDILNTEIIETFIKNINEQLKEINEEQCRLSIEHEQQQLMALQQDSNSYINKLTEGIQKQEVNLNKYNQDFDFLIQIDNQLFQQQQSVNQQFNQIKVEFKFLEDISKIYQQEQLQLNEVDKQNKQLSNLIDKLKKFEQTLSQSMSKVSVQKKIDLQKIVQNLNRYIDKINEWEYKINYYNEKQILDLSKEEQEILQELKLQLQTQNQIKQKIQTFINQLQQNQIQNSYKIFTSIQQEYEISTFKIEQIDKNYQNVLNKLQQKNTLQNEIQIKQKEVKAQLNNQSESVYQSLNDQLKQCQDIQDICRNEANLQYIFKELERIKILFNDYQKRIQEINRQITDFEKTQFTNLEEVKLAEGKLIFLIDFISQQLKSQFQKMNEIKQEITQQKSEYLDQNFKSFKQSLGKLKQLVNGLLLNQTEQQCYQNIQNQKEQFQKSIENYQKQLDEDIQGNNIHLKQSNFNMIQEKKQIQNQIDKLQKKQTHYNELIENQKNRISYFKKDVLQFDDKQMENFVRNYLSDCQQITNKVQSLELQSSNLNESQVKDHIHEFNTLVEQYRKQIEELLKKKKENNVQFNNIQFYCKNLEILNSFNLLFQQLCLHKREIIYFEQSNPSQNQIQQKKQKELNFHLEYYDKLEKCLNYQVSQYEIIQDKMLIQYIKNYLILQYKNDPSLKQLTDSQQKQLIDSQLSEMDFVKQLQELNKLLEVQIKNLKVTVIQQNNVKIKSKLKPQNDDKKQFVQSLKEAFESHIPKLSAINLELLKVKFQ